MRNIDTFISPLEMGYTDGAFWASFYESGRVYNRYVRSLNMPIDGLRDFLGELCGVPAKEITEGTFNLPKGMGTLKLDEIEETEPDKCGIKLETLLDTRVDRTLRKFFDTHEYVSANAEGVFNITIRHFFLTPDGIKAIYHHKDTESFSYLYDELYPGIDVPVLMNLYSESTENNLILTGSPGTGKTCFVKKCLSEHALNMEDDINVVYVKDPDILEMDSFWATMSDDRPDIIVLDDLDDELIPRTEGRNPIVNNLLSFSDGLFDSPTKVLITTNQPNSRIDSAVIRPGRCFDILGLKQLTHAQAVDIWVNTLEADIQVFKESFGDAVSISQAALMSEHARWCKLRAPKYLLDPSISIRTLVESGTAVN